MKTGHPDEESLNSPGPLRNCPIRTGVVENPAMIIWEDPFAAKGGECEILRLACDKGRSHCSQEGSKIAMRMSGSGIGITCKMKRSPGWGCQDASAETER